MVQGGNIGDSGAERKRLRRAAFAALMMTSGLATLGMAAPATAQEATRTFDIAAQPLADALTAFGQQSGLQVSAQAPLVEGRTSNAVRGAYSPMQALSQLLTGTGLSFRVVGSTVTLEPAPQSAAGDGAIQLGPVRVEGATGSGIGNYKAVNERLTTEGTGSYTTRGTAAATRMPLTLRETPQSVSVVTNQQLKDRNLDTLDEALKSVTGIVVQAWEPYRSYVYSRGFYVNNFQRDGLPNVSNANDGLENTILYDRIEIVRGATGLLTGAGDPSASINLVRKRATSDVLTAEFSASAGSWKHFRGTADISTPLTKSGNIRARIVGSVRTRDSFSDFYKDNNQTVLGTVDIDIGSNTTLTLSADYQHRLDKGVPWGGLPLFYSDGSYANWKPSDTTAPKWATNEFSQHSLNASLEHSFGEEWYIKANYSYLNNKATKNILYLDGFPDKVSGLGLETYPYRVMFPMKQHSVDLHVNGAFNAFGRKHGLVFGAMHSDADQDSYNASATTTIPPVGNFFEWDGSSPKPSWTPWSQFRDDKIRQSAIYGALRLSLADPVKVIAGARYSKWKADNSGTIRSDEKFTPYAGIIVDITKQISAYASYTSIFNPQDYKDRNGNYLSPVIGKNYEVGLKGEHFDGRLNTAISVFRVEQSNVAERDGNVLVPGTSDRAYVGLDGVTTKGFEVQISGEPLQGWQLSTGFSRAVSRQRDGTLVNGALPRNQFNFFSTYEFDGSLKGLRIGAGGRWQSSIYSDLSVSSQTVRFKQGSIAIVDALAAYEFNHDLSIQANVDNIFDKKYYQYVDGWGTFGTPRSFMVKITKRF